MLKLYVYNCAQKGSDSVARIVSDIRDVPENCATGLGKGERMEEAVSHTAEEEMNQRRRLLNAAKKGDQKAIAKLFELYHVRVHNNAMVTKLNRTAATHRLQAEVAKAKAASKGSASSQKSSQRKSAGAPVKSKAKHDSKPKTASVPSKRSS